MAIEPKAEHTIRCLFCQSDHVAGNFNEAGQWYGYCLTCGGRFWENPPIRSEAGVEALIKNP